MWMSTEDARSDVILAGATAVFGVTVVSFVQRLPLYPRSGILSVLLDLAWLFALTALVPWLLTRHRKLGAESYGLDAGRDGWRPGLLLAVPVIVAGVLRGLAVEGVSARAVLGRFAALLGGDPAVRGSALTATDVLVEGVVRVVLVAVLAIGSVLLVGFLTVRGRDAFSRQEVSATEAIRTFGMGAAAAALLFGLLRALGPGVAVLGVLVNAVALAALVLLADRLVPAPATTARAAVLTPLVVVALGQVLGALRGDLLYGLYTGALAAGVATVVACVLEGRQFAWAVLPPLVATAVYPTCLSPLPLLSLGLGC